MMVGLHIFIKYTKMGKAMRATSQDKKMAGLVGININYVISVTFIIGSALASVGGVMISMYVGATKFDDGYLMGIVNGRMMDENIGISLHTMAIDRGLRVGSHLFAARIFNHLK